MAKTTLKLPDRFDINQVADVQRRMQAALAKDAEVIEVNAMAVRLMDSSCMQLLLSYSQAVSAEQKTLKIVKPSELIFWVVANYWLTSDRISGVRV